MTGRFLLGAWLVVLWVMLWGDVSVANVLSGVAVAGFVLIVVPVRPADDEVRDVGDRVLAVRPIAALRFLVWVSGQIVVASVRLAWEVVTPTNSIAMGVVRVPLRGVSDLHTTIVANVVTLTPGTISLDVLHDPPVLEVHVLHLVDRDEVIRSTQAIERRVIEAFGTRQARRVLDEGVGAP